MTQDALPQCTNCGEEYPRGRAELGFKTCLVCGEEEAKKKVHTVVPMHKSNLVVIGPNELEMLKGISNKGGQISGGGQNLGGAESPAGRAVKVTGVHICNLDEYAGPIESAKKTGYTRARRRYVLETYQDQANRPTRQPWHKRSEPKKK